MKGSFKVVPRRFILDKTYKLIFAIVSPFTIFRFHKQNVKYISENCMERYLVCLDMVVVFSRVFCNNLLSSTNALLVSDQSKYTKLLHNIWYAFQANISNF